MEDSAETLLPGGIAEATKAEGGEEASREPYDESFSRFVLTEIFPITPRTWSVYDPQTESWISYPRPCPCDQPVGLELD